MFAFRTQVLLSDFSLWCVSEFTIVLLLESSAQTTRDCSQANRYHALPMQGHKPRDVFAR